jgi:hypothetical protein
MALSVVDLYREVLPKTNCGDCGYRTCLAFAGMVVSEQLSVDTCPHIDPDRLPPVQTELTAQHADGKWTKRDMAEDALAWAKERAASMALDELAQRIDADYCTDAEDPVLVLPYFNAAVHVRPNRIERPDGEPLTRWEQVFLYNHMAQGGAAPPTGRWVSFKEIPNTVSKQKTMVRWVEVPLAQHFNAHPQALGAAASKIGGLDGSAHAPTADEAIFLQVLPRVPVVVLFWNADPQDGFEAQSRLLFDETVAEHLDVESILFFKRTDCAAAGGRKMKIPAVNELDV